MAIDRLAGRWRRRPGPPRRTRILSLPPALLDATALIGGGLRKTLSKN